MFARTKKYGIIFLLVIFMGVYVTPPAMASHPDNDERNRVKEVTVVKELKLINRGNVSVNLDDPGKPLGTATIQYTAYNNKIVINTIVVKFDNGFYPLFSSSPIQLFENYRGLTSSHYGIATSSFNYNGNIYVKEMKYNNVNKVITTTWQEGNASVGVPLFYPFNVIVPRNNYDLYYSYWYNNGPKQYNSEFAGRLELALADSFYYHGTGKPHIPPYIYTTAHPTGLTYSDVSETEATLWWGNPNTNTSSTKYTLQRRKAGQEEWESIPAATNTTATSYKDTALVGGITYEYRVWVHHTLGPSWDVYSDIIEVTTEENPATAAAKEAALKANQARDYAIESMNKSQEVYDLVSSLNLPELKEDMSFVKEELNKVKNQSNPIIIKTYTANRATATTSSYSPPIKINSSGATHFQLSLDGITWSEPYPVMLPGEIEGLSSGLNNIYVRAYNDNVPAENRTYAYGNIDIFRL